jgi:hypothetical protein
MSRPASLASRTGLFCRAGRGSHADLSQQCFCSQLLTNPNVYMSITSFVIDLLLITYYSGCDKLNINAGMNT